MRILICIIVLMCSFFVKAETYKGYEVFKKAESEKALPSIYVPPTSLLPTQTKIGMVLVTDILNDRFGEKMFSQAKLVWDKSKTLEQNLTKLGQESLEAYVKLIQASFNKAPFLGTYTPRGIFHFDGHHRSRAIYEINSIFAKISSNTKVRVFLPVALVADYSQMSDQEIAEDIFVTKKQGYVSSSLLKISPKDDIKKISLKKYEYLKKNIKNLGSLKDDPYRSLLGKLFFKEHIDTDNFVTYLEFYIEELYKNEFDKEFSPHGLKSDMPLTDEMVQKVKKILFSDSEKLRQIAYWARFSNLSKEESFERCVMLEKKDDTTETPQEIKDEMLCKKNREDLLRYGQKKLSL